VAALDYDAAMARRAAYLSASFAVVVALVLPWTALAAPPPDPPPGPAVPGSPEALLAAYDNAINAFKYQDFDNAVPQLRALVYPKVRLDQKREWRVREYLGAALWFQGDTKGALDEFTALLVRNPQTRLDPAVYPPKMIADFEGLRQNLVRLGVLKPDQQPRLPDLPEAPADVPFGLTLFPFGVGQFANREPARGTVFLVAEAVLGSVSVGYYLYNRDLGVHGERSTSAVVTQVSTGAGFFLVAGWGIIDAIVRYRRAADAPR
jgi:hypothetical protein